MPQIAARRPAAQKFHAGKLAKSPSLLKKWTDCLLRIHFFSSIIEQIQRAGLPKKQNNATIIMT
jgi:hypothetical protein